MPKPISIRLCPVGELPAPAARGFEVAHRGVTLEVILVHWETVWYAYQNSCPHTGVNLNWTEDQFFDPYYRYLQCAMHGALFQPHSGYCVQGPCRGEYLSALPVTVHGEVVYLLLA
ncbi:MAG: Rieske 2Fe-2S domain-containing protein [Gammaproteobacteria bacterium]|nr:Rieske 2Fe-2S domain-containing protein [Gammaproteobacteria bacterium]